MRCGTLQLYIIGFKFISNSYITYVLVNQKIVNLNKFLFLFLNTSFFSDLKQAHADTYF